MKKLSLIFLPFLLGIISAHGQSSTEPSFVPFRPDMKSKFNTAIDPKKFKGNWTSLDGEHHITIYQEGDDVLVGGDYFPGVASQGDRAKLFFPRYAAWEKKDPALHKINLMYSIPASAGGGGRGITIAYSPSTDHLIIGTPPYNTFENGQWVGHGGSAASNGIFGKEFKREATINPNAQLHLDVITVTQPGFEYPYCTYAKISGQPPIFISNVSGGAVMKINGLFITLNFVKTGTDSNGKHYVTYAGGGVDVTIKTGRDLKKGVIVVTGAYTKIQVPVIGSCSSAGAD